MVSARVLLIINISLAMMVALLVLLFMGVKLPTLGQAQYALDKEEPLCMVEWKGNLTSLPDLDRCCLQARGQLECGRQDKDNLDWVCGTGAGLQIRLNNKAYNYCRQQPYW